MQSTGDPAYNLIAATYKQVIRDAHKGGPCAVKWLEIVVPNGVKNALPSSRNLQKPLQM